MVEKVAQRAPEPEPQENIYEYLFAWHNQKARNMREGKVVIHGRDLTWEQGRQALLKFYLTPKVWNQVGTPGWFLFINRIIRQSGKHRHQGGLGIYVLEGKGYTVVDGVKYDWEKDDLILLPVKDGGCEHQHFNTDPTSHRSGWPSSTTRSAMPQAATSSRKRSPPTTKGRPSQHRCRT